MKSSKQLHLKKHWIRQRGYNVKILDACCGSKMFWYEKNEPHTTYMDIRDEVLTCKDKDRIRTVEVNPDVIADFRKMPFEDNSFDLVIFDPPHLLKAGDSSWLVKKYGKLGNDWKDDLRQGFDECMRVLKPSGTMLFKWNEDQIKIREVFEAFGRRPILGDKRSKTKWSVFIK